MINSTDSAFAWLDFPVHTLELFFQVICYQLCAGHNGKVLFTIIKNGFFFNEA